MWLKITKYSSANFHPISHLPISIFLLLITITSCRNTENRVSLDHPTISGPIIDSVNNLLNSGMINPAMAYLDSAYRHFPQAGPADLWKKYHLKNNFYSNYVIDAAKSRSFTDSMFMAIKGREKDYHTEYASTLFDLGNLLMAEKKYPEAFKQFYKAREYVQKNLDSCQVSRFTHWLGLVRYRQGQYLKAIPYLKHSVEEYVNCGDNSDFELAFVYPQSTLNTIALSFDQAGQLDSALTYYSRALSFIDRKAKVFPHRKTFIAMARGVIYGNMGGVYAKLGDTENGEKFLKQSIQINDRLGYAIDDAQTARVKLANLYIKTSRFDQAEPLLNSILADINRQREQHMNVEQGRLSWYQLQWRYFDRKGEKGAAYDYATKYYNLNDSLQRVNEGFINADMEQEFKNVREESKLALLDKNNQLKSFSIFALSIFSVIIAVALILIYYSLKRYRKLTQTTREQNNVLRYALNSLEESQADNTRIMKVVAHDLRNPIGSITMITEVMLRMDHRQQEDVKWLEMIAKSANNSLELVSDLLLMNTRSEDLIKEPLELMEMIEYCVEMLNHKAEAKGQRIDIDIKIVNIIGSREKLWRVVSNLISNAIKFSHNQTVIKIRLQDKTTHALISVEDEGIGIPEEVKDKIFDMFTQAKRQGTMGEQPFGMGLAIAKQIVEAHQGKLWFENKESGGTTFHIELPIDFK